MPAANHIHRGSQTCENSLEVGEFGSDFVEKASNEVVGAIDEACRKILAANVVGGQKHLEGYAVDLRLVCGCSDQFGESKSKRKTPKVAKANLPFAGLPKGM